MHLRKSWLENAFDMKFGTVILCNVIKKNFQNCSYTDDDFTNYDNFFEKLCEKWLQYDFFLKLTLWQLEKRFSRFFSAFESQGNIQIEYIYIYIYIYI